MTLLLNAVAARAAEKVADFPSDIRQEVVWNQPTAEALTTGFLLAIWLAGSVVVLYRADVLAKRQNIRPRTSLPVRPGFIAFAVVAPFFLVTLILPYSTELGSKIQIEGIVLFYLFRMAFTASMWASLRSIYCFLVFRRTPSQVAGCERSPSWVPSVLFLLAFAALVAAMIIDG